MKFLNKSDKVNTYFKTDGDSCLSILQAGITNRVLITTLNVNGKFKLHATSDNTLKNSKTN